MNNLEKIKQGKNNYKIVNFPGTDEKVALVILTSNEIAESRFKADEYIKEKDIKDEDLIDLEFQKRTVYKALREKDDRTKLLASSYDEFIQTLDNTEIQYLMVEYSLLTTETSPFLNSIDEETFETLKKTLEKIQWNDLNGPSLIALRNFLVTLA